MIKFDSEKLVSLTAAARLVPKRRGRSTAVSTLYRWANRGIGGRRLETLRIGAATFTSVEALQRFFDTLTELSATPSVERPSRRDVDHELDRFGL